MRAALVWTVLLSCGICNAAATEFSYVRSGDRPRYSCTPQSGWQGVLIEDSTWAEIDPSPDGGTRCGGTRFVRYHFDVGTELGRVATVTLRVRYEHGFAAYLNGVEMARRQLAPQAEPSALATEPHGPEAERIFVPVRPGLLRARDNVLAVEIHPRTAGREPRMEVELSGSDGPRVVRGPYLQRLTATSVTVVFDSDVPTIGEVHWGATRSYGRMRTDPKSSTHHALLIDDLRPGTSYHYRALIRAPASPPVASFDGPLPSSEKINAGDTEFHTAPDLGEPLRFAVYGDVRSGHDVHGQIERALRRENPDFAILTGDLVDRGSDDGDWERFFEVAGPLLRQMAIFPAIGNHEYASMGRGAQRFFELFRSPLPEGEEAPAYYSFDLAGVHFVALDSSQYRSPRQLAWFKSDLERARAAKMRALFVYAHAGPYSVGLHGDNASCIHDYVPLMQRYHVSMFFGGHDHDFERGQQSGFRYVVTGGGGAELRASRCTVGPPVAGAPQLKACPPRVQAFYNEHNFVIVEVLPTFFRICPKRPDGTALEACTTYPLESSELRQ
jgi:hypothetical protein